MVISTDGETPEFYVGTEWFPFHFLPIRLGTSNGALTAGMGVAWRGVRINYARIFEKHFASNFIELAISFQ